MPMRKRLIRVKIKLTDGTEQVLDENLMLNVKIIKAALQIQSQAIIEVGALSQQLRQGLLSQFTAYAKRQREQGDLSDIDDFINVSIDAGYLIDGNERLATIFKGQVALCELSSPPPNVVIRITCFTRQIDKTKWLEPAPDMITFKAYCEWAASKMGLQSEVNTSINDMIVENPGRTVFTVGALLLDIQRYDRQNIAAFVDNDTLYVMDIGKVVKGSEIIQVKQFVGMPSWSEWGVDFNVMMNQSLKLAHAVQLNSVMNPGVNISPMVIMRMEYDLASRSPNFFIKCQTSPSAGE